MLNKSQIKCSRRAGRIHPYKIDPHGKNNGYFQLAERILSCFVEAQGKRVFELEDELSLVESRDLKLKQGLIKLLYDACEYEEGDESWEEQRWQTIELAQDLRLAQIFDSLEAYKDAVAQGLGGVSVEDIARELYGDLPRYKRIMKVPGFTVSRLIHRYNCAQVQALLLRAYALEVIFNNVDIKQLRSLLRTAKFFQLVMDIEVMSTGVKLMLSGPLSIFEQTQRYGMRLANFFPYILHFKDWKLKAEIRFDEGSYDLVLDDSCGIQSHYVPKTSYIPDEFKEIIRRFNQDQEDVALESSPQVVKLGDGDVILPDFSFWHKRYEKYLGYIEIFHPWHKALLKRRLQNINACRKNKLYLFVHRKLWKDVEELGHKCGVDDQVYLFKQLPLRRDIQSILDKVWEA